MKHTVDHYPNHYFSIINIISVFTQTYFDLSLEKLANLHDLHRYPKVWHFQFFKSWQSVRSDKISLALWCSAVYLAVFNPDIWPFLKHCLVWEKCLIFFYPLLIQYHGPGKLLDFIENWKQEKENGMLEWNIFIVKTNYANTKVNIHFQVYFWMALVKTKIRLENMLGQAQVPQEVIFKFMVEVGVENVIWVESSWSSTTS